MTVTLKWAIFYFLFLIFKGCAWIKNCSLVCFKAKNENLNNIIYDRNRVLAHWIIICKKNNFTQKISRKRQKSYRRSKNSLWKYDELNIFPPIYLSADRGQELQMNNLRHDAWNEGDTESLVWGTMKKQIIHLEI